MNPKADMNQVFGDKEKENRFRVVVFGSARTKPGDPVYEEVFELGKDIADAGWDVVTGGGPGAMQAANMGHEASENEDQADSYGINIKLPFEQSVNPGVEIAHEHERFSTRLDEFMSLANVVVITQGGIGTMLELFYTWQLIQVKQMCHIPIIVMGDMWPGLFEWLENDMLSRGMFSPEDLDVIQFAKDGEEAMELIRGWHDAWVELGDGACFNSKMYKLEGQPYTVLFDENEDHEHSHG